MENILQQIQALRVSIRDVRDQVIEGNLNKEDYAKIADFINFPLHDVEEIKRIALYRSK